MFEKILTRIFVRDKLLTERGMSMDILKSKTTIILIIMILGVSYVGGVTNSLENTNSDVENVSINA